MRAPSVDGEVLGEQHHAPSRIFPFRQPKIRKIGSVTGRTDRSTANGSASRRWIVTLLATVASTWALDATATAAGVAVAASGSFDAWSTNAVLAVLALSYLGWAGGLGFNLRANSRLLASTGVSTNALSKLAYDLAGRTSPRVRTLAGSCGYVATELIKELPYVVGVVGAALASTAVDGVDAIAFLVGANAAAAAYELAVAGGTRVYLRRAPVCPPADLGRGPTGSASWPTEPLPPPSTSRPSRPSGASSAPRCVGH